jgi:hypothetical protein
MIDDPTLKGVSVLIFDEFHERHLYGDITLARALDVQETQRPDLRLAVMSATLDADLLADYFGKVGPAVLSRPRRVEDNAPYHFMSRIVSGTSIIVRRATTNSFVAAAPPLP